MGVAVSSTGCAEIMGSAVGAAGPPDPGAAWQYIGMAGRPTGARAFVGIPLLTIGPRPVRQIVLR